MGDNLINLSATACTSSNHGSTVGGSVSTLGASKLQEK
jgi:hypothetical protein